jgi:hypothetical protein
LVNTGNVAVPLSGVRFTAGVTFDFTSASITNLAPAQRVLVVSDPRAFALRYGTNLPVAGQYNGSLSNSGELIRLVDPVGQVIQEFTYDDSGDWPASADGQGNSLEVTNLNGDLNVPTNWRASSAPGGSPGADGSAPALVVEVSLEPAQVRLRFEALTGHAYTVYASDSLVPANWEVLKTVPATEAHQEEVVDSLSRQSRYYKVSSP